MIADNPDEDWESGTPTFVKAKVTTLDPSNRVLKEEKYKMVPVGLYCCGDEVILLDVEELLYLQAP